VKVRLELENEQVLELIGILDTLVELLGPTNERMRFRQALLNQLRSAIGLPILGIDVK
jgi:hypothetical protein